MKGSFSPLETTVIASSTGLVVGITTYFIARPNASQREAIQALTDFALANKILKDGKPDLNAAVIEMRKVNNIVKEVSSKKEEEIKAEKKVANA